jgi:hypothetical protein
MPVIEGRRGRAALPSFLARLRLSLRKGTIEPELAVIKSS